MDRREFATLLPALLAAATALTRSRERPTDRNHGPSRQGRAHPRPRNGDKPKGAVPFPRSSPASTRLAPATARYPSARAHRYLLGMFKAGNIQLEIHETIQEVGALHEPSEKHLHNEIWFVKEGVCELTINGVTRTHEPPATSASSPPATTTTSATPATRPAPTSSSPSAALNSTPQTKTRRVPVALAARSLQRKTKPASYIALLADFTTPPRIDCIFEWSLAAVDQLLRFLAELLSLVLQVIASLLERIAAGPPVHASTSCASLSPSAAHTSSAATPPAKAPTTQCNPKFFMTHRSLRTYIYSRFA